MKKKQPLVNNALNETVTDLAETQQKTCQEQTVHSEISDEIINWDELIEILEDEELINEIVPIFLKESIQRLASLTEAVESNDINMVEFYAHTIKGSARNVAAKRLWDITYRIEAASQENNLEAATELFDELKCELEKIIKFLSRKDWIEVTKRERVITNDKIGAYIRGVV